MLVPISGAPVNLGCLRACPVTTLLRMSFSILSFITHVLGRAKCKRPSQMNIHCFANTSRTISHDAEAKWPLKKGSSASHHRYPGSALATSLKTELGFLGRAGIWIWIPAPLPTSPVSFGQLALILWFSVPSTVKWINQKATSVDCMLMCSR